MLVKLETGYGVVADDAPSSDPELVPADVLGKVIVGEITEIVSVEMETTVEVESLPDWYGSDPADEAPPTFVPLLVGYGANVESLEEETTPETLD